MQSPFAVGSKVCCFNLYGGKLIGEVLANIEGNLTIRWLNVNYVEVSYTPHQVKSMGILEDATTSYGLNVAASVDSVRAAANV